MRRENRTGEKAGGRARSPRGVYDDEEEEPFRHGRLEGGPFNSAKNDPPPLCSLASTVHQLSSHLTVCVCASCTLSTPYHARLSPPLTALSFPAPLSFLHVSESREFHISSATLWHIRACSHGHALLLIKHLLIVNINYYDDFCH